MAQKLLNWFITESGKKFTFRVMCTGSLGICAAYTVPNTIFLDKYKEVVHLYKSGIPVKLSDKILERYNKALNLLQISDFERKIIKPFACFGFDVFNAGTLYSRYGGLLGIPVNFTYLDEDHIETKDMLVLNEPVNWASEDGQQLLDSLVLSENAQLFAIAREVLYLKSLKLLLDCFYASSTLIMMYGLSHRFNAVYNLHQKPLLLRSIMYGLVGLFGFGVYSFCKDYTQVQYDQSVDKELSEKNPIFVEGGKEFYEKSVSRNIALRKLMGRFGEKQYSALGNENFFIRQKCLPLVTRKSFFEEKLKESL